MEFAALSLLALHLNDAVHGVHNMLGNGHAQAGTLGPVNPGFVLAGEGVENLVFELRRHADAVVLDMEMGADIVLAPG